MPETFLCSISALLVGTALLLDALQLLRLFVVMLTYEAKNVSLDYIL
jgi:hypothetical protein